MAGPWWPEYLAGEAELQFDRLTLHLDLLRPGRRSVRRPDTVAWLLDLSLNILSLGYGGSDGIIRL